MIWTVTRSINQRHRERAMYRVMVNPCVSQTVERLLQERKLRYSAFQLIICTELATQFFLKLSCQNGQAMAWLAWPVPTALYMLSISNVRYIIIITSLIWHLNNSIITALTGYCLYETMGSTINGKIHWANLSWFSQFSRAPPMFFHEYKHHS